MMIFSGFVTAGPNGAFSSGRKAALAPPFATAASTSACSALPSPPWIRSSMVVGAVFFSALAAFSTSRTPFFVRTPRVRRSALRKVQSVRPFGIGPLPGRFGCAPAWAPSATRGTAAAATVAAPASFKKLLRVWAMRPPEETKGGMLALRYRCGLDAVMSNRLARFLASHASRLPATFWCLWSGALLSARATFVFPFLALFLTARGLSPSETGFVASLFAGGMIFAGPVGGALADRIGRKPTLLACLTVAAACAAALALVASPVAIAALVFLFGVSSQG